MFRAQSFFRRGVQPSSCEVAGERARVRLRFEHALPLLGFIIPTLVMGYGFVLPRNAVSLGSELSFGFGSTVLGACVTYALGIRAALRR